DVVVRGIKMESSCLRVHGKAGSIAFPYPVALSRRSQPWMRRGRKQPTRIHTSCLMDDIFSTVLEAHHPTRRASMSALWIQKKRNACYRILAEQNTRLP